MKPLIFAIIAATCLDSCSLVKKSQHVHTASSDSTAHNLEAVSSATQLDTSNFHEDSKTDESGFSIILDPSKAQPDTAGQITIEIPAPDIDTSLWQMHGQPSIFSPTDVGFVRWIPGGTKLKIPANTKEVHFTYKKSDVVTDSGSAHEKQIDTQTKTSDVDVKKEEADKDSAKTSWRPGLWTYIIGAVCLFFFLMWLRKNSKKIYGS